jgi:ABC-type glycerol-3-phosphate transport system substrate-binding protein
MKLRVSLLLVVVLILSTIPMMPASGQDTGVPEVLTMPDQIAEGRDVSITISNKPPADQENELAVWEAQVAAFTEMYPNVSVDGLELEYDPVAYLALVAGDQLPTLFQTYFTEPEKFIGQGAVADLSSLYEESGVLDVFNANVLDIASQDGAIYGIPESAYSLGLAYNIRMLTEAGYDAPPATWDELIEVAQALTDRDAGVSGFAFINDGSAATGWHYTNIAYGFGASPSDIIESDGDGNYDARFGSGATVDALQYIYDLRWEYDVLPLSTLDWGTLSEALATERVAMAIYAGDQFAFLNNQFPDADISNFGYAAVPAGPNGRIALTGGNVWLIDGRASDDEQEAAFYYQLWRQLDPEQYAASTISLSEQGRAIGVPVLPLFVGDYQAQREAFESDYYVLPVENYALFNDVVKAGEVTLQEEPPAVAQEYYTELGILVSEVLSIEQTDPESRIAEVSEEFQAFVLDR